MGMQRWTSTVDGRAHRVEADDGLTRTVRWYVDDELAAEKRAMEDRFRLESDDQRLEVRFSSLGAPRRATVGTGADAVDLVPEPGSKAARHEEAVLAHPTRYSVVQTVGGIAKVVVPIALAALLARFAISLPWPSVPTPDLPSLPSIPWPSIPWPSIPLPSISLPDWSPPGWVERVWDVAHYVWPVVLAFVLARAEINRRRRQDERRREAPPEGDPRD